MGDIVTITNGNSNVQDAVTQSKDGLYPFFDRSEDIKYWGCNLNCVKACS